MLCKNTEFNLKFQFQETFFCCVFLIISALPYCISLGQFLTSEVLWTHVKLRICLHHYKDFLNDQRVLSPKTQEKHYLMDFKSTSALSNKYLPYTSIKFQTIQNTSFVEQ